MAVLQFDPLRDLDRFAQQLLGAPAGTQQAPRFMPMDLYRSGDHDGLGVGGVDRQRRNHRLLHAAALGRGRR